MSASTSDANLDTGVGRDPHAPGGGRPGKKGANDLGRVGTAPGATDGPYTAPEEHTSVPGAVDPLGCDSPDGMLGVPLPADGGGY